MSIHDFEEIEALEPGKEVLVTLGIDFNDRTQGAKMDIMWGTESEPVKKQNVTIQAPVGELIRAVSMSEALFITEQGTFSIILVLLPHPSSFYYCAHQSIRNKKYTPTDFVARPSSSSFFIRTFPVHSPSPCELFTYIYGEELSRVGGIRWINDERGDMV